MREFHRCDEQCEIGFCPAACGPEGFCYFSTGPSQSDNQALVSESLKKQSLIINSKQIVARESKCFKPGEFSNLFPSCKIAVI